MKRRSEGGLEEPRAQKIRNFVLWKDAFTTYLKKLNQDIHLPLDQELLELLHSADFDIDIALIQTNLFGYPEFYSLLLQDYCHKPIRFEEALFLEACRQNKLSILQVLFKNPRLNSKKYAMKLLLEACQLGHLEILAFILEQTGIDPALRENALVIAASGQGQLEIVKFLLSTPKVGLQGDMGTALGAAVGRNHQVLVHYFLSLPNIEDIVHYEIDQATKAGDLQTVQLLCQYQNLDFSKSKALGACYRFGHLEIMIFLLGDERMLASLKSKPNVATNVCLELIKNNYLELADKVAIYCNTRDLMNGLIENVNAHIYIQGLAKVFIEKNLRNMLHHFLSDARTNQIIASNVSLVEHILAFDPVVKKECISKIILPYFFKRYSAVQIGMNTKESNLSLFNQDIFYTIVNLLYLLHTEDKNCAFVIPCADLQEKSIGARPLF